MSKFLVTVTVDVRAYATVEVEAPTGDEALATVQADIDAKGWDSSAWQARFEPDWSEAENLAAMGVEAE